MGPAFEGDRQRFMDTFVDLMTKIDEPYRGMILSDLDKFTRGEQPDVKHVLSAIAIRIVAMHFRGAPLELPPIMIGICLGAGAALEMPLLECGDCGYSVPRCLPVCPLCGGPIGENAYAVRRGRVALSN